MLRLCFLILLGLHVAKGGCPHLGAGSSASLGADTLLSASPHRQLLQVQTDVDWDSLRKDLTKLMTDSQDFWPADQGHYGGLFVRLAWHCAGSYRKSDGRGGCDGARQRFDPERSWPDNTNLDKARALLQPIKLKYGHNLSWGDLIILAGNTAIESMGLPTLGFCGGRTDDVDGSASVPLGPNIEQEMLSPCPVNGNCTAPLGPTTVGLIYVNPEGPMGKPDVMGSFPQTRDSFGRMGMNGSVSKPGCNPNPNPTLTLPSHACSEIIKVYASDIKALEKSFTHAWYKLQTRDMGPVTRCMGKSVPPAQPFQYPLPPTPTKLADFDKVRKDIKAAISAVNPALTPDYVGKQAYYGALFATLAWRCAATFRATDYAGGCNGARIRLSPQKDWPINQGMDKVLDVLKAIKQKYDSSNKGALSWADLIVLAGQTAVEKATGKKLKFCGGRVDSEDGGSEALAPRDYYPDPILEIKDSAQVMGLTTREYTALSAQLRSPSQQARLGYNATTWTDTPDKISNSYVITLLNEKWSETPASMSSPKEYVNSKGLHMMPTDVAIKFDPESLAVAQEYAIDNDMFVTEFISAWTRVMNADRFDGPYKNLCTDKA